MTLIKNIKFTYDDKDSIVRISNTNYKTFKSFSVSRSIDDVCGAFNIGITRPPNDVTPFKTGDIIDIILDDVQVMRGKIYEIIPEGDAISDDIILAGRDITGDIVDSTVPDDSKVYTDGVSIFDIAGKILRSLGLGNKIQIINLSGESIKSLSFTKEEIISCKTGYTVIKFLLKYCRKRQLFLNTDVFGNLVFFKAKGFKTGNQIINEFKNNQNNVVSYKSKFNISKRFHKYICKSQDSALWLGGDDAIVDTDGIGIDGQIETTRILEFKSVESMSAEEAKNRAAEEANVRRARGFEYTAVVQGFKDKRPWAINQFVTVSDEKADVHGEFLIKGVVFNLDNLSGRTTKLILTDRDAYTAQATINKIDSRKENNPQWQG